MQPKYKISFLHYTDNSIFSFFSENGKLTSTLFLRVKAALMDISMLTVDPMAVCHVSLVVNYQHLYSELSALRAFYI